MDAMFARSLSFRVLIFIALITPALSVAGDKYSSYYGAGDTCQVQYDPFEKFNRKVFAFNNAFDKVVMIPISKIYKKTTTPFTRARVSGFVSNLKEPISTINYTAQKRPGGAIKSIWIFLINSTFGLGGMFDIAGKFGLKAKQQDFGTTLAYYGASPGPYIVIPFVGGTSARDSFNLASNSSLIHPVYRYAHRDFQTIAIATGAIRGRAALLDATEYMEKNSIDYYVAMREALHQNRESKMEYPLNFKCSDKHKL